MSPPPNTQGSQFERPAALLAGGFTTVAAFVGIFGTSVSGSLVERMVRNHPCWASAAFVNVALSIGIAILALVWLGRIPATVRKRAIALAAFGALVAIGAAVYALVNARAGVGTCVLGESESVYWAIGVEALLVAAVIAFAWGGGNWTLAALSVCAVLFTAGLLDTTIPTVLAIGDQPRPSVAAVMGTPGVLGLTVKATGIRASQHLRVAVDDLEIAPTPTTPTPTVGPGTPPPTRLPEYRAVGHSPYTALLGSNPDGVVDITSQLPLPSSLHDAIGILAVVGADPDQHCIDSSQGGCVIVRLPQRARGPQLSATWADLGSIAQAFVVGLTAENLRPEEAFSLEVTGKQTASEGTAEVLYASVVQPDAKGSAAYSVKLPVSSRFRVVCVRAAPIRSPDALSSTTTPSPSVTAMPTASPSVTTEGGVQALCKPAVANAGAVWAGVAVPTPTPTSSPTPTATASPTPSPTPTASPSST